jgi:hypothetical protein
MAGASSNISYPTDIRHSGENVKHVERPAYLLHACGRYQHVPVPDPKRNAGDLDNYPETINEYSSRTQPADFPMCDWLTRWIRPQIT